MIGQLNRRITLKAWGSEQDDIGAPVKTLVASYTIWAKVESRNGRMFLGHQQETWTYDYKITFRYEKSRVVASNQTIDYDGKRLAINSVSFENEGNRRFCVARCSTTDEQITEADGEVIVQTSENNFETYNYYGEGGETTWTESDLIGKQILGAFKDGVGFEVIYSGTPTGKQVKYSFLTGTFLWSVAYTPGEYTLIQYR